MHYCTNCGAIVEGNFCGQCGTKVNEASAVVPSPTADLKTTKYREPLLQNQPSPTQYQQPKPPYQPSPTQYQQPKPPYQPQPSYQQNTSTYPDQQPQQYQQPGVPPQIIINNLNTNTNTNIPSSGFNGYESPKSKWLAFLLCVVAGYFGIHRFYTGKIGTGILWACTGGLFSVGWFIDAIALICGKFRDSNGLELKS